MDTAPLNSQTFKNGFTFEAFVRYINGSKDVRNSHSLAVGLQTTGKPWLVGATHWLDSVGQSFYGWLGDVRIVNRPLSVQEFMIARDTAH